MIIIITNSGGGEVAGRMDLSEIIAYLWSVQGDMRREI
jgi:hypothetical protein